MKFFIKSVLIVTLFLIVTPTLNGVSTSSNYSNQYQNEKLSATLLTEPLIINGNYQLSTYATKGDGSKINPFILKNYQLTLFNRSQTGIELENINDYFILNNFIVSEDSNIWQPGEDIMMVNVSHGTITNSELFSRFVGIDLYICTGNYIIQNQIANNFIGIRLNASTHNVIDTNLISAQPFTTQPVTGYNNIYGIDLIQSNFNLIQNNKVYHYSANYQVDFSNNSIFKNNIAQNGSDGFFVDHSENNSYFSNKAYSNFNGFSIFKCSNSTFSFNTAIPSEYGFDVSSSNYITFINNTATTINPNGFGLLLEGSNHNLSFKNNQFGRSNLHSKSTPILFLMLTFSTVIILSVVIIAVKSLKMRHTKHNNINSNDPSNISKNSILFCPKCHNPYTIGTVFCENCGSKIN